MSFTVEFAPGAGPFDVVGQHYLSLTGGAGSASTPDAASLDITGDLDIRCDVTLDQWTPIYNPVFVAKWTAASNQRSYIFWMFNGRLALSWSTDGTLANSHTLVATADVPVTAGRITVRAALDVDNLGVSHNVAFYSGSSVTDPNSQVGDLVTDTGTTSIFSSSATLLVGNVNASESPQPLVGRIHAAQVRSGIGGSIVANPDFAAQTPGASSFVDSTGKTWTINAPAALVGSDWVDLTSRLVEASWTEGREDELEHYGPGEATIMLRNDDRALDPDHAGGPWFGKLRPRTPFRIREPAATPADRFYGFVHGGFEQSYLPPSASMCTVELTDRLSAVAGLLPDVFDHTLVSRDPVGLWRLESDSGSEQIGDLSGHGHDGQVAGNVTFGEPPIAPGHGTSARFDAVAPPDAEFGYIDLGRSPLITDTGNVTLVATFKARSAGVLNFRTLFIQHNGTNPGTGFAANVDLTGRIQFAWVLNGGGIARELTAGVVDGKGHLLFGQSDGIAVDTATLSTATTSVATGTPNGVGIGGYAGIFEEDDWDGWIGTVAVYDRLLTFADREFILDGYSKLSGRRTDEVIGWALDRVGVPAELRNLEQGTVIMGPADAAGQDALEFIRDVVATEQGEFYVDHRDGGKLRFRNRYARFADTRSTTPQATFTDDPGNVTGVGIQIDGLEVAPNGIDGIVNQVQVSWRDGDETVTDDASVAAYGPQTRSVDTQATTASQARSTGEWIVARYAQPRSRVRGIVTRPDASTTALTAARALKVGDRVTYRFRPQQVGAQILTDLFVEGIEQAIGEGVVREATYRLAPVNTFTPWTWGVSDWDTETVWG